MMDNNINDNTNQIQKLKIKKLIIVLAVVLVVLIGVYFIYNKYIAKPEVPEPQQTTTLPPLNEEPTSIEENEPFPAAEAQDERTINIE